MLLIDEPEDMLEREPIPAAFLTHVLIFRVKVGQRDSATCGQGCLRVCIEGIIITRGPALRSLYVMVCGRAMGEKLNQ